MRRFVRIFAALSLLAGCGGSPSSSTTPTASPAAAEPKPAETATAAAPAGPQPAVDAAPAGSSAAAPDAAVKATIGGRSLSVATVDEIQAELKKAGWPMADGETVGGFESKGRELRQFLVSKGGAKALVTVQRPTPGKAVEKDSSIPDAKTAAETPMNKGGATFVEGDVLVSVLIKGKKADAQKLLDALVKK